MKAAVDTDAVVGEMRGSVIECLSRRLRVKGGRSRERGIERAVPDEKDGQKNMPANEVSEETGQYDARFILWRAFCNQNGIPVETLPSELKGDNKDRWDEMKDNNLHKQAEEQSDE
jgi:hypothetical protein